MSNEFSLSNEPGPATGPQPANRRAPLWQAFRESVATIRKASADKSIRFRSSDIATAKLMRATLVAAVILTGLSLFVWQRYTLKYVVIAQLLTLFSIGLYAFHRFGILRTLKPNHALICWQLIVGISLFSAMLTFTSCTVILGLMFGSLTVRP